MIDVHFVLTIHDEILEQTAVGCAGVNLERLCATLGRIDSQLHYNETCDAFLIAAWYGIALAKGHAFVDGNKRTALAVMLSFLEIQGIGICPNTPLDDLMVDIVISHHSDELLAPMVANFLYAHSTT